MKIWILALLLLLSSQSAFCGELVRWAEEAVGLQDVDHFVVEREGTPVAIVPSSASYFIDYNGSQEDTYRVRVVFTTAAVDIYIDAQDFTIIQGDEIPMSWSDNSDNEDGFEIERREPESDFTSIGTVDVDVDEYTDTVVSEGKRYIYRVRAFNEFGYSGYSNQLFTFVLLKKPTNVILSLN